MSDKFKFRDVTPEDVEVRVQQCGVSQKGIKWANLLIYKNARFDMNLLDEIVGAENWQRKHYECKGTLFCEIGIKIGDEWIWKGDAGTPSNAEGAKGEASDSFKRAGFNWGIGRELYTAPDISVFGDLLDIKQKGKGYKCDSTFEVTHLVVENKKITELKIATNGTEIFTYPKKKTTYNKPKQATQTKKAVQTQQATPELKTMLLNLKSVMDEKGITEEQVKERFNIKGSLRNVPINTIDGMIKKLKQDK